MGTVVALLLGSVGPGVQLLRTGLTPVTLLGEVPALVLVAAALLLSRRSRPRGKNLVDGRVVLLGCWNSSAASRPSR